MRSVLAKLARFDPTRLDLALPRPWVCGLLVLLFLGFGAIVGRVSSSPESVLSASARPELRLVLPPPSSASSVQGSASTTPTPSTPTEAPEPEEAASTTESESSSSGGSSSGKHTGKGGGSTASGSGGGGSKGGGGAQGGGTSGKQESAGGSPAKLPPIKHVFLIVLADQPYASVFGPAGAPYLAKDLERRGELLVRYYAVAHDELANGIALLSGQGPTPQTEVNCPTYADLAPATGGADGQTLGQGCVYPASTGTLAGQLLDKHLTWKAYVEGMGEGASSPASPTTCAHPQAGAADPTISPTPPATPTTVGPLASRVPTAYQAMAGMAYATFRNPFVYFDSVIDGAACAADDVGLDQLTPDLSQPRRTPSFSYIVPSLCDDGSPTPCAPGRPAGLPAAEGFLRRVVPRILASKAYKQGGLLVITVDQAPSTGVDADSSSCCGQPRFPALVPAPTLPGGGSLPPTGGGQVGALLLSPYVKPGAIDQEAFNHFSLLRTIENIFKLSHLGYAAASGVGSFGASMFSARR